MPVDFDAYPKLEYWTRVRDQLFDLMKALENKIDRERRAALEQRARGMTTWVLGHLRVARQTYLVVETVARDRKELSLPLEASVAIAPLARVLLESVFSIVFVFEQPAVRLPWFWKATWAQIRDEHAEFEATYRGEPAWDNWLRLVEQERDAWRDLLAQHGTPLTSQELSGAVKIAYWPNPGKMRRQCTNADRRRLLDYLDARLYGDLSSSAHLSGIGMMSQASVLLADQDDGTQRKYFSDRFLTAMTMAFTLVSVLIIDVVPERSLAERAAGLWRTPKLWDIATELYRLHFETRLSQVA